jgi:hypothetical protein
VNRCKYVALIRVTIADNMVNPTMMHSPIFVETRICSFQKADMGTMAKTKSVIVVYALRKYEKSFNTEGLQHLPLTAGFHRAFVGLHWKKTMKMEIMAMTTCRMTMA